MVSSIFLKDKDNKNINNKERVASLKELHLQSRARLLITRLTKIKARSGFAKLVMNISNHNHNHN